MDKKLVLLSLILVVFSILPLATKAATLYLLPQSQTVYQNDTFIVEVRLNTGGEEINTVGVDLVFPDLLETIDFSEGNSIFTIWAQRPTAGEQDLISFVGGIPQGFVGDGLISKITFKAVGDKQQETSKAQVSFKESSKVLLNDGKATEAEIVFLEANYEIVEKPANLLRLFSRTHSDQNKWYKGSTLHVKWDLEDDVLYSYILTHDALAEPDETPDKPEGSLLWIGDMEYPNLNDGIYYFHLRKTINDSGQELIWGPKTTHRLMIDTLPPETFKPKISQDASIFEGKYFLSFLAVDKGSGIDHYRVLEISNKKQETLEWKIAESPYLLKDQTLESIVKVEAVDKAGNERVVEIIPKAKPISAYWIIILILTAVVFWWVSKKLGNKKTGSKR